MSIKALPSTRNALLPTVGLNDKTPCSGFHLSKVLVSKYLDGLYVEVQEPVKKYNLIHTAASIFSLLRLEDTHGIE